MIEIKIRKRALLLFPRCHEFIDRRDDCLLDFPRLLVSLPPVPCASTSGWERIEATEDHGSFNRIYRNAIHEGEWRRDTGSWKKGKGGSRQTESYISTSRIEKRGQATASDVLVSRARQRWPTPKSSPIQPSPPPLPEIVETCKPKVPHVARKFPRGKFLFSLLFGYENGTNRNYKYLGRPPPTSLSNPLSLFTYSYLLARGTDIIQILPSYCIAEFAGKRNRWEIGKTGVSLSRNFWILNYWRDLLIIILLLSMRYLEEASLFVKIIGIVTTILVSMCD